MNGKPSSPVLRGLGASNGARLLDPNRVTSELPHGIYWSRFLLAFSLAMTAVRVLIAWIYTNTKGVLLAQLMHVSSTASLVIFSPPAVNGGQEALWYALYAVLLWLAVAIVVKAFGRSLRATTPGFRSA